MSIEMHVLTNTYNGHRLVRYIQLPLPEKTIRVKYKSGVTPSIYGATVTPVTGMADVYDLYYESDSWASILNGETNLLEVIDANLTGVTTLKWAFLDCSSLTKVHLTNTTQCINVEGIFKRCTNLSQVDLFDTSNVTTAYDMFSGTSIVSVPLFDTSNLVYADGMFGNCSKLKNIPLFNTSNIKTSDYMFFGCVDVESGALALYNQMSSQTTPPTSHNMTFNNCGANTVTGAAELAQIPASWK